MVKDIEISVGHRCSKLPELLKALDSYNKKQPLDHFQEVIRDLSRRLILEAGKVDRRFKIGAVCQVTLPIDRHLLFNLLLKELNERYPAMCETFIHKHSIEYCSPNYEWDSAEAVELVLELMKKLDQIAPVGHYFGSHKAAAGVFGFWEIEQDTMDNLDEDELLTAGI